MIGLAVVAVAIWMCDFRHSVVTVSIVTEPTGGEVRVGNDDAWTKTPCEMSLRFSHSEFVPLIARFGNLEVRGMAAVLDAVKGGPWLGATWGNDGSAWVMSSQASNPRRIQVVKPVDGSFLIHYSVGGWIAEYSWFEVSGTAVNPDPASTERPSFFSEGCIAVEAVMHSIAGKGWTGTVGLPPLSCVRLCANSGSSGIGELTCEVDPERFRQIRFLCDGSEVIAESRGGSGTLRCDRFEVFATRYDGMEASISIVRTRKTSEFRLWITTQ